MSARRKLQKTVSMDQELGTIHQLMLNVDTKLGTANLADTVGEIFENTSLREDDKFTAIAQCMAVQLKDKIMHLDTISMTLQAAVQFLLHLAREDHLEIVEMILEELSRKMFGFLPLAMFPGRRTRYAMIRDAVYLISERDTEVLHRLAAKRDEGSQLMLCHILDLLSDCDVINGLNSELKTPLFVAVENGALKNAVTLLANGASPNIGMRGSADRTPLKAAATAANLDLVRLLLLYDANLEPVLGLQYPPEIQECIDSIHQHKKWIQDISQGEQKKRDWLNTDFINALSIDGGGIRGLVSAQILIEIDSMFGSEVIDSFSWTAGTSTGSILSLALSLGKSPLQCRNIYLRLKDKVFVKSWARKVFPLFVNYDNGPLEQFLKIEFGRYTKMSSIRHKRVLVTSSNFDIQPIQPVLFRNYSSEDLPYKAERWQEPNRIHIWLAARCSSAAPYYFNYVEPFSSAGRLMDGGLVANNPTRLLLLDIEEELKQSGKHLGCVVSLGTGHPRSVNIEPRIKRPQWLRSMAELMRIKDVLLERATDSNTLCLTDQRTTRHLQGKYFRFTPELKKNVLLDETDDHVIIDLMWETKMFIYTQKREELGRLYRYLSGMDTEYGTPLEKSDSAYSFVPSPKLPEMAKFRFVHHSHAQLKDNTSYIASDLNEVPKGVVYELRCECNSVFIGETDESLAETAANLFRANRTPELFPNDPIAVHRMQQHPEKPPFYEVWIHGQQIDSREKRQEMKNEIIDRYIQESVDIIQ